MTVHTIKGTDCTTLLGLFQQYVQFGLVGDLRKLKYNRAKVLAYRGEHLFIEFNQEALNSDFPLVGEFEIEKLRETVDPLFFLSLELEFTNSGHNLTLPLEFKVLYPEKNEWVKLPWHVFRFTMKEGLNVEIYPDFYQFSVSYEKEEQLDKLPYKISKRLALLDAQT